MGSWARRLNRKAVGSSTLVSNTGAAVSIGSGTATKARFANGVIKVAPVRLSSLEVNGIRVYDVPAAVLPDEALATNLLGMSFLGRVRRFEMANGRLVMEQ